MCVKATLGKKTTPEMRHYKKEMKKASEQMVMLICVFERERKIMCMFVCACD